MSRRLGRKTLLCPNCGIHLSSLELTRRQTDVLRHMAEGLSNAEIASILGVAEKSVANYINAIYQILGLTYTPHSSARVKAVLWYQAHQGEAA